MARKIVVCAMGLALALVAFVPAPLGAQTGSSSIAGVVKDTTGAVLPGVTVEASSPALIEKVRSVVTDGEGRYNIVDLRLGTYTVTFTLAGFNTFRRDGIELGANFTATVNGDLRVGTVEETITVSGEAPVVDTQSSQQQQVYTRELMDNLPANRNFTRIIAQYPAARVLSDVGGTNGEYLNPGNVHGSATNDTSYELDGMVVTGGYDVGGINNEFYFNNGSMQEIITEVSGLSAESMLGGMHFNAVPKEGSNRFAGTIFTNFANHSMQGNNVTPDLLTRGVRDPNTLDKVWDINPSLGGPLVTDKLWFFWGNRWWGTYSAVAGNYYNLTPNSVGYKYTPADGSNGRPLRQAQWRQHLRENDLRLTWQAAQKHKISLYYGNEYSDFKDGLTTGGLATANPDAVGRILFQPNYVVQATWSYPATNRLLFEAGGSLMAARYYTVPQPGQDQDNVYTVVEQSTAYTLQGLTGKSDWWTRNFYYRASASYITGSHAFKAGMTLQQGYPARDSRTTNAYNYNAMILQLNGGVPNQVTIFTDPIIELENLKANLGLYVQDKWTRNRLTLSGGLRYDSLDGYVPAQDEPAGPWVAARHFDPIYDYPDWRDLSPRLGASYDLFGNGKTALKASMGRYPLGDGTKGMTAAINPVFSTFNSAARSWTDSNGNFLPDCDLVNPLQNGECGQDNPLGFGGLNRLNNFSDAVRSGLNIRPYNWEGSVGINHEVTTGVGVGLAYFHRRYGGQTVTRNILAGPSDYDPFCVTAPTDPLLGAVSGQQICGFMNIKPTLFGQVNNLIEPASKYGSVDEHFNGVDLTINARLANKVTINGGLATGKSVWDGCEALAKGVLPKIYGNIDLVTTVGPTGPVVSAPSTVFCHQETPWLNQLKIFVVYPLPWDFQVSANFQSTVGPVITAQYPVPNTDVARTLGRLPSGGVRTVTVNLISPGSQYDNQQNQLDARFVRTFRVGKTRLQGMLDLYNLLNANPDVTINTAYGPKYLVPTRILLARMVKVGMQLNF